jgi:hypothetical protein
MNRSQDIRHVGASNKLGFGRKQRLQVLGRELQLGLIRVPPDDLELESLGHEKPGLDIRLMLHLGQDDLIALVELQSTGEVHEKLRRRRSEDYGRSAGDTLPTAATTIPISSRPALMYFAAAW